MLGSNIVYYFSGCLNNGTFSLEIKGDFPESSGVPGSKRLHSDYVRLADGDRFSQCSPYYVLEAKAKDFNPQI